MEVLGDLYDTPVFIAACPKRGYEYVAPLGEDSGAWRSDSPSDSSNNVVGRGIAVAKLDRHLEEGLRGKRQIVFVTGEAGIGKTTLVDLFHGRVVHRAVRIARGQCVEGFGGKEAYFPMLEALGHLIRDAHGSNLLQALAQRAPTWLIQFPSLVEADQNKALQQG